MTLSLTPVTDDPFSLLLVALRNKILNADLSFKKYLVSLGISTLNVFDQTVEADRRHAYDPPISLCPAVVLMTSGHPPVRDRGIGNETWHFEVGVFFKMELPQKDSRVGLHAFWELIRTVMVSNKVPQLDPLHVSPSIADYWIEGDITPPSSDERTGFRVASGGFVMRFRFSDRVLT